MGLAAVAAWNFEKTRERDDRLRKEEARSLAGALSSELDRFGFNVAMHALNFGRMDNVEAADALREIHNMDPVLRAGFVMTRSEMRTLAVELHPDVAFLEHMIARLSDFVELIYGGVAGGPDSISDANRTTLKVMTTDLAITIGTIVKRLDEFADTGTLPPTIRRKRATGYDYLARAAEAEKPDEDDGPQPSPADQN